MEAAWAIQAQAQASMINQWWSLGRWFPGGAPYFRKQYKGEWSIGSQSVDFTKDLVQRGLRRRTPGAIHHKFHFSSLWTDSSRSDHSGREKGQTKRGVDNSDKHNPEVGFSGDAAAPPSLRGALGSLALRPSHPD